MRRAILSAPAVLGAALALGGCESAKGGAAGDAAVADAGGSPDIGGADVTVPGDVSADPDFDWPASQVALELAEWGLSFTGALYEEAPTAFHAEAGRDGICRLLTYEPEQCDPSCLYPAVCRQGACVTQPASVGAGPIVLSGFSGGPITVEPTDYGTYFWQTEELKAADAAATIGVKATGSIPFDLSAGKVTAPTPDGDWVALLTAREDGADVTLSWTDPDPGARVYLRMTTGVGTHGGISPVEIECEGPDTGSLRLPGAWLDALYAKGWSCGECGGNDLWRTRAATSDGAIPVQFRVQARTQFWYHPNFGG